MVNYGISRGCAECKKRRKKCDEIRPACRCCTGSGESCSGYEDESTLPFRHWSSSQVSNVLLTSLWSSETDDETLESLSLDIFLTEFTTQAADRQASRGFLDGIQPLLKSNSPQSSLVCSAKIVALASMGIRLNRKSLIRKTERHYGDLLGNLHQSLYAETQFVSIEALYTAVLLGLYEIIISRKRSPMQYTTHVRGVCAILSSPRSPFRLESGRLMFQQDSHIMNENDIVAYWPLDDDYAQNLNATLFKFQDFSHRAELHLRKELPHVEESKLLQQEAFTIDEEFSRWGESITDHPSYTRVTVASLDDSAAAHSGCGYCHSGLVETYSDYYIAAIWNTYRKAQIILLDIMAHLERRISKGETPLELQARVEKLVADIIASIPYHLAYDVDDYLRCIQSQRSDITSNRPFSGFLLLYPLFESAKCHIVPHADRLYLLRCLSWIGEHMGIGQASLLSACVNRRINETHPLLDADFPFKRVSDGNALVCASMGFLPKYSQ